MTQDATPVYSISLPEYTVDEEPDFEAVGRSLDGVIEAHFPGRWLAIRGIGLRDHPYLSLDELAAAIAEVGTDRYDPRREDVHAAMYRDFTIHLHATACLVTAEGLRSPHYDGRAPGSVMGAFVSDFYGGALYDRGYAVRLDLLMLYGLDALEPVRIRWTPEGPVPSAEAPPAAESSAFLFKNPDQKQQALLGIIKILR